MTVSFTSGEGYELLVGAVAVADPRWRSVLTGGEDAYLATRAAGADLVRDVGRVGRYGWINLLPLLPGTDGSRTALLDAVAGLDAEDLHHVVLGARRVEPTSRSDAHGLVAPDRPPGGTGDLPAPAARPARPVRRGPARRRTERPTGGGARAGRARSPVRRRRRRPRACGHHRGPSRGRGRRPARDDRGRHPPLADGEPDDAAARLRLLARAAGDQTRMRVLQELRGGSARCRSCARRWPARGPRCSTTSRCSAGPGSSMCSSPSRCLTPTGCASRASTTWPRPPGPSRSGNGRPRVSKTFDT